MTNLLAAISAPLPTIAFPAVSALEGATLYRVVLRNGRKFRTIEQWRTSQADAEQAARIVCEDWRGARKGAVVLVYPVPAGVAPYGYIVGGP